MLHNIYAMSTQYLCNFYYNLTWFHQGLPDQADALSGCSCGPSAKYKYNGILITCIHNIFYVPVTVP